MREESAAAALAAGWEMLRETAKCEMRFDGFNVYITRKPKPLSALILWRNQIPSF